MLTEKVHSLVQESFLADEEPGQKQRVLEFLCTNVSIGFSKVHVMPLDMKRDMQLTHRC